MRITGSTATEIAGNVRDLIAAGVLAPRTVLPPIRDLARDLEVNRNTVAAAYRQLVAAGVAETWGRGGTVVAATPHLDRDGFVGALEAVDLASGNPDPELLPDLVAAARCGDYRSPLYGTPAVHPNLAEWATTSIADDVERSFQVVVAHGAVDAVERLLNAHLTRGDVVAVEDPCFLASIGTLRLNGYRTAAVPVDWDGMVPEHLEAALSDGARAVVCTPRAHNPTGAGVTAERAAELREILARYPHVLVIEDDHFSAVSAKPYHRITPAESNRWALVRSVSKFLGPDLRLALIASDDETSSRLQSRLSAGTAWVSWLLQHTAHQLLTDPATGVLLDRAKNAYAERSTRLVDHLQAHGVGAPYVPDGLNVWIELDVDAPAVVEALAARRWAVRLGTVFGTDPARNLRAVRITTSTITPSQSEAFAADLAAVLDKLRSTSGDGRQAAK